MNQNSNKPTFKSNNRTFSERSVGDDRQKRDKNRPHFASSKSDSRQEFRKARDNDRNTKPKFKRAESQEKTLQIAESTMKKAGGAEGNVKVTVKSSRFDDKPREKKPAHCHHAHRKKSKKIVQKK